MINLIKSLLKNLIRIFYLPFIFYKICSVFFSKDVNDGYIVISPSLTLSGAPLLSEKIYENISRNKPTYFLSIFGGKGISKNKKMINMNGINFDMIYILLSKILTKKGYKNYILNSIVSSKYVRYFKNKNTKCISLIHEMSYAISVLKIFNKIPEIYNYSDSLIFSCKESFNTFKKYTNKHVLDPRKIVFMKQGLYEESFIVNLKNKDMIRKNNRSYLNINSKELVILGVGNDLERKGFKYFLELSMFCPEYKFIWIGNNPEFLKNKRKNITIIPKAKKESIYKYFYISDYFFLSSVEDPFPTVLLEAMVSGLPLISIKGSGGADELINENIGFICDRARILDAKNYIRNINQKNLNKISNYNRDFVIKNFNFDNYVDRLISLFQRN